MGVQQLQRFGWGFLSGGVEGVESARIVRNSTIEAVGEEERDERWFGNVG